MSPRTNHVPLAGSYRAAPRARPIGAAPRLERLSVSLLLRPAAGNLRGHVLELAAQEPAGRQHLSREEFGERFGATSEDIGRVRTFARNNGLDVVRVDRAARIVEVSGTTTRVEAAFGVTLWLFRTPTGVVRGRSGRIFVPRWLAPTVRGVFGLDTRGQARPRFRVRPGSARGQFRPAAGPANSFTVPELSALYDFPAGVTGAGQTIGMIELGGGFVPSDLAHYFSTLGINPAPSVVAAPVDGVANHPTGDPTGPDGEVVLDIEVAGAAAPGANIVVFFAPNTSKGFLDAVNAAVHDAAHHVTAMSISWGGCEGSWTAQSLNAMDASFQAASALGIPVFCASGDNGSSDGAKDGLAHADFPASSPFAVGCGGTTMNASGGAIAREVTWNAGGGATGGGVSAHFPVPQYQSALNPTSANPSGGHGRGVPDVAAVADPATGYQIFVDGKALVFGGTSAVAPLYAGLTALVQQSAGKGVAPLHQALYQTPNAFRDVLIGDNGDYAAGPGWDACTGLGTPIGTAILNAHTQAPAASTKTSDHKAEKRTKSGRTSKAE